MVVLSTKTEIYITEKCFLTKRIIQGMLNIFYILSEKKSTFLWEGGRPSPLIADMSAKKSSFFYTLPKVNIHLLRQDILRNKTFFKLPEVTFIYCKWLV